MIAVVLPSTLSDEERKLKEIHEKLKQMRRLIVDRRNLGSGDGLKIERSKVKRSLEQAEFATEEVRRKVIAGAITVKKVKEKRSFKRPRIDRRRHTTGIIEEGEIVDSIPPTEPCSNPLIPTSSSIGAGAPNECGGPPTILIRGSYLQEEEVKQRCGKFGDVLCIKVDVREKTCFVQFRTEEQALVAIKEMNGSMANGITIEVCSVEQHNSNQNAPGHSNLTQRVYCVPRDTKTEA